MGREADPADAAARPAGDPRDPRRRRAAAHAHAGRASHGGQTGDRVQRVRQDPDRRGLAGWRRVPAHRRQRRCRRATTSWSCSPRTAWTRSTRSSSRPGSTHEGRRHRRRGSGPAPVGRPHPARPRGHADRAGPRTGREASSVGPGCQREVWRRMRTIGARERFHGQRRRARRRHRRRRGQPRDVAAREDRSSRCPACSLA